MSAAFYNRHKTIIIYGFALALLAFLLRWLQWKLVVLDRALELYEAAISIFFTGLGVWAASKLIRPKVKTIVVEKQAPAPAAATDGFSEEQRIRHGLSTREIEVLQLMAQGCSNQEIAARLFLSVSTIKTHSSRIFEKLDVKRRTQAVEKSIRLRIISLSTPASASN